MQELSTRQRSLEWTRVRNNTIEKADEALELAQDTLTSCAGDIQQHASDLQHWFASQQADLTQPEDAYATAGMSQAPLDNE